jgi:metallo-beta-lactamase family protein
MCNAGRILHHLRQNLWRPETHVLFVGYQAPGSLGRQLIDGKKLVSIFGEKVAVRASIHTLGGFSAHAGQRDLMDWIGAVADCRPRVFLTHGETRSRTALANLIRDTHQLVPAMPGLGESIELLPRAS